MDSQFDIRVWFRAFLHWMRTYRAGEAVEVLTDCSNELYQNSLTAQHLRHHGRERGFEHFWARCEWEKVDICYGQAAEPFADWNTAWRDNHVGQLGEIEGKVLYGHFADAKRTSVLATLESQLDERYRRDTVERRVKQAYHGLIWLLAYEPPEVSWHREQAWIDLLKHHRLKPVSLAVEESEPTFHEIGALNTGDIWPLEFSRRASLSVMLCEFDVTRPRRGR